MNPGDLVYTCFNTYSNAYGPVHYLSYPYDWLPFRMQLPVMDTLKLLAGFWPHTEYLKKKKKKKKFCSLHLPWYSFSTPSSSSQQRDNTALSWNVGHVIWIGWEMHWSIFFANCLWEWDTHWIPWVHQWAVLQLLLYGHHQYWYNFRFCNNYTYKHKLKCHFISELTTPPLVKQNINIYIHATTKQSTKLLYSLWLWHAHLM